MTRCPRLLLFALAFGSFVGAGRAQTLKFKNPLLHQFVPGAEGKTSFTVRLEDEGPECWIFPSILIPAGGPKGALSHFDDSWPLEDKFQSKCKIDAARSAEEGVRFAFVWTSDQDLVYEDLSWFPAQILATEGWPRPPAERDADASEWVSRDDIDADCRIPTLICWLPAGWKQADAKEPSGRGAHLIEKCEVWLHSASASKEYIQAESGLYRWAFPRRKKAYLLVKDFSRSSRSLSLRELERTISRPEPPAAPGPSQPGAEGEPLASPTCPPRTTKDVFAPWSSDPTTRADGGERGGAGDRHPGTCRRELRPCTTSRLLQRSTFDLMERLEQWLRHLDLDAVEIVEAEDGTRQVCVADYIPRNQERQLCLLKDALEDTLACLLPNDPSPCEDWFGPDRSPLGALCADGVARERR